MKKAILLLSLSLIFPHLAPAADAGSDVAERYSYTMGVRLGQLLRAQGISQLDSASFAQAIDDVDVAPAHPDDHQMEAVRSQIHRREHRRRRVVTGMPPLVEVERSLGSGHAGDALRFRGTSPSPRYL